MKPPAQLFAALTLALAAVACAAEEKVLNVFTWPDYIAPDTISKFVAEYGIKVNYDTYDSTEMAEARLLAGRTGYDVVVHAERTRIVDYDTTRLCGDGCVFLRNTSSRAEQSDIDAAE